MKQYIALVAFGLGIFSFAQHGPRQDRPQHFEQKDRKGPQKDFHRDDRGPRDHRKPQKFQQRDRPHHPEFSHRGPQRPPQPVPVVHAPSKPGIYIVIR